MNPSPSWRVTVRPPATHCSCPDTPQSFGSCMRRAVPVLTVLFCNNVLIPYPGDDKLPHTVGVYRCNSRPAGLISLNLSHPSFVPNDRSGKPASSHPPFMSLRQESVTGFICSSGSVEGEDIST